MTANLYDLFRGRFPRDRAAAFIETVDGRVYRYADLEDGSARMARLLAGLGVAKGDRVAAQVEKSPEAVFLYLACLRMGAIYLPLNPAYRPAELDFFLGDAAPRAVVCDPEGAAAVRPLAARHSVAEVLTLDAAGAGSLTARAAECEPQFATVAVAAEHIAAILYTSGTTGRAKGAMLSHRNLAANALTLHAAWGWRAGDVLLHALPIFHTHGLFVATNCVLLNGSPMLFMPRFDAGQVISLLPRATLFMGVPTYYVRLLAEQGLNREVCRRMRLFISGSAPLLEETFQAFQARTGHVILERYGMTETGMNTANPLHGERMATTVGPPLAGVEVRVVDDAGNSLAAGEIGTLEVRGPNVFKGYWRLPDKTAEAFRGDGFLITGDLARIDADGYVSIVGRQKDLVISGGLNVYPKEVEAVIDRIDGVIESAVIGVPHPDFGEAVVAIVVRSPGTDLTEGRIIRAAREALAGYKTPKRVFLVDALPRNSMGKVQKKMLRSQFPGVD